MGPPLKASIYALIILAFTGGRLLGRLRYCTVSEWSKYLGGLYGIACYSDLTVVNVPYFTVYCTGTRETGPRQQYMYMYCTRTCTRTLYVHVHVHVHVHVQGM